MLDQLGLIPIFLKKKKKKTSIVFPSFLDGKMKGQPDLCAFNKKIRQECVLGDLKVSVL